MEPVTAPSRLPIASSGRVLTVTAARARLYKSLWALRCISLTARHAFALLGCVSSELCKTFHNLVPRIQWSFDRHRDDALSYCSHCLPDERRGLRFERSGAARCSVDIRDISANHPWAGIHEQHLMSRAWYLGAQWASRKPTPTQKSMTQIHIAQSNSAYLLSATYSHAQREVCLVRFVMDEKKKKKKYEAHLFAKLGDTI